MCTTENYLDLLKIYCRLFDQILGCQEDYQEEELVELLEKSKKKHKHILLLDEQINRDYSEKISRYCFDAKCIERHIIINLNKSLET